MFSSKKKSLPTSLTSTLLKSSEYFHNHNDLLMEQRNQQDFKGYEDYVEDYIQNLPVSERQQFQSELHNYISEITPTMLTHALFWASISRMFKIQLNRKSPQDPLDPLDPVAVKALPLKTQKFIKWMHLTFTCEYQDISNVFERMPGRNDDLKEAIRDMRRSVDTARQAHTLSQNRTIVKKRQPSVVQHGQILIHSQLQGRSLLEWLQQHGPDPELWHSLLSWVDWGDESIEVYGWIVRQVECDAATAAEAFHLMNPFDHLGPPEQNYQKTTLETLKHIIMRWESNDFQTYIYEFSDVLALMTIEADYRKYETEAIEKYGQANFIAPSSLFTFQSGKIPNPKYRYY